MGTGDLNPLSEANMGKVPPQKAEKAERPDAFHLFPSLSPSNLGLCQAREPRKRWHSGILQESAPSWKMFKHPFVSTFSLVHPIPLEQRWFQPILVHPTHRRPRGFHLPRSDQVGWSDTSSQTRFVRRLEERGVICRFASL